MSLYFVQLTPIYNHFYFCKSGKEKNDCNRLAIKFQFFIISFRITSDLYVEQKLMNIILLSSFSIKHYMKVHSEKNFKCVKCDKRFGLARDCQRHEEECGQTFSCPQCGKEYTKKDSLLRHCDVQKHKRPNFPPK